MRLAADNINTLLSAMRFTPVDGASAVYAKSYPSGYTLRIDLGAGRIEYADADAGEDDRIGLGDLTTSNLAQPENLVVLECVDRLLEKGYAPGCLAFEKIYPSGRGHSGKLDILVNTPEGHPFLMIECKTWGREYDKEYKKMLVDGGQLFTYYKNATAARHLCLYSSHFENGSAEYVNSIVDTQAEWAGLSEVKDIYEYWNKTFKDNGIFDSFASPYNVVHKRIVCGALKNMSAEDSGKIYNHIMEILRHNAVSDKPNAFNKILNLFVCKIIDETTSSENDELKFQCWAGLSDEDLQMTLNDLYKDGIHRFLNITVIDHTTAQLEAQIEDLGDTKNKAGILKTLKDLRLKKSPNFAFAEVLDERSFQRNAKIVREIVELLQGYKFRYEQKHEFLGKFFELLLNTSMKQEAGQFFTPVPITRFIISSLPIKELTQSLVDKKYREPLPAVIDFACGSGHFLTEYMSRMQHIIEKQIVRDNMPREMRGKFDAWSGIPKFDWAKEYVYGIDSDDRLVKTTKVSAFFNGDGEATIVWGNGLDSFQHAEEYRGKLKETVNEHDNGQFDILISNPPFSVQAFRTLLKNGNDSFELFRHITDNGSEIECLFVERMKQLLKPGGWAGVILPSSMLSNGGVYARTREIIFKYFTVKAIVELGSGTFMKTGTNTVILFLERRPDIEHRRVEQAVNTFFTDRRDVAVAGIEYAFSRFVSGVYDDLSFEDYLSFISGDANETMKAHELWQDYVKAFGGTPYQPAFEVEREKMLYFLLTYKQNIVLVKSGRKQDEKEFLGYEFSERRGNEGMKPLPNSTKLFDENSDALNPQKVNSYIYNAFLGKPAADIDEAVAKYVSYGRMSEFFEYGTRKFDKRVNLNKKTKFDSTFPAKKLSDIAESLFAGGDLPKGRFSQIKTSTQEMLLHKENFMFDEQRISDVAVMVKRGKSAKYGTSHIQIIKSGQARGYLEFDFSQKHFVADNFVSDERNLIKGDVLINSTGVGTAGRVTLFGLDGDFVADSHITVVRFDQSKVYPKYAMYALANIGFKTIEEMATGQSGQIEISLDLIKNIRIPLPPLEKQREIVTELEKHEREIARLRGKLDELNAAKASVLDGHLR